MKVVRWAVSVAAVLGGAELLRRGAARRARRAGAEPSPVAAPDERGEGVDETSEQSFPASDAPGWTGVTGLGRSER